MGLGRFVLIPPGMALRVEAARMTPGCFLITSAAQLPGRKLPSGDLARVIE
jgi:hypothetical protein